MDSIKKDVSRWFPRLRIILASDINTSADVGRCLYTSEKHPKWLYLVGKSCSNANIFKQDIPVNVVVDYPSDMMAISNGNNFFFSIARAPTELAWRSFFKTGLRCNICGGANGRSAMCMSCGTCTCHRCLQTRPTFSCLKCGKPMKTTEVVKTKRRPVTVALDASTSRTTVRDELEPVMADISFILAEIYAYRSCPSSMRQAFFSIDLSQMTLLRKNPQPSHPSWALNIYPIQPLARPADARRDMTDVPFVQSVPTWDAIIHYVEGNLEKRFGIAFPYQGTMYALWVKEVAQGQLLVGGFVCCTSCGSFGTSVKLRWCKRCRAACSCSNACAKEEHGCENFSSMWNKNQLAPLALAQ